MLPIDYYKQLLSVEKDDYAVYAESKFPQENRKILIGSEASTKYTQRGTEMYRKIADYLRNFTVSDRDMNKYIIGTMSNIDQPMTPSAKGDRAFNLYMNKVSAETIKKERLQILEAGQEDIRKLADVVEAVMKAEQVCVIGSEEKIEEAKDMFKNVTTF